MKDSRYSFSLLGPFSGLNGVPLSRGRVKGLLARSIREESSPGERPCVSQVCSACPETRATACGCFVMLAHRRRPPCDCYAKTSTLQVHACARDFAIHLREVSERSRPLLTGQVVTSNKRITSPARRRVATENQSSLCRSNSFHNLSDPRTPAP